MADRSGITGRTYIERGEPVTVITAWRQQRKVERLPVGPLLRLSTSSPRNVAVRRADGTVVVRPFRGLRVPREAP